MSNFTFLPNLSTANWTAISEAAAAFSGTDLTVGTSVVRDTTLLGGMKLQTSEATATLAGASTDIDVDVPLGAKLIGAQLRVDTLITSGDGAATWAAAYKTGATQAIGSGLAFAKQTKHNAFFDANADTPITSGVTKIAVTPNAGTFSGGVVQAIVYYEAFVALPDAP